MIKRISTDRIRFRRIFPVLSERRPEAATPIAARFSLRREIPEKYVSQRFDNPVAKISFTFPADDAPRVRAWFSDDYSGVSRLPSTTLQRNLTSALHDALDTYIETCSFAGLFTAPFTVGFAWRLSSGKHRIALAPAFISAESPYNESPIVAVRDHTVVEQGASTYNEIYNSPSRLEATFDTTPTPPSDAVALDVIATRLPALYDSSRQATDISTVAIGESRLKAFNYPRYTSSQLRILAEGETDTRVIASYPADGLPATGIATTVPVADGALVNWKTLPSFTSENGSGGGTGSGSEGPDIFKPEYPEEGPLADVIPEEGDVEVETEAMDLGYPEQLKWMRGIALRGIFANEGVKLRLYGAHHLEKDSTGAEGGWHLVAESKGSVLRRLRAVRYRLWKVGLSLHLNKGDRLEAVAFDFTLR